MKREVRESSTSRIRFAPWRPSLARAVPPRPGPAGGLRPRPFGPASLVITMGRGRVSPGGNCKSPRGDREVRRGLRRAEQIALDELDAEPGQGPQLLDPLDALGHH